MSSLKLLHATVRDVYAFWEVHAGSGCQLPYLFQGHHPEQP